MITAGPTWVAIDQARVISNLSSGETGFILADKFKKLGAQVTLLLGPGNICSQGKGIRLIHFKYYWELAQLLDQELKNGGYAAVIHAAAVADYQPQRIIQRKVSSQLRSWRINLVPTQKLIKGLKIYQPGLLAVGFKFEPNADLNKLIAKGRELLKTANVDIVVANSNQNQGYQAYILDGLKKYGPFLSKAKMAICLSRLVWN